MSRSAARPKPVPERRLSLLLEIYSVNARMAELVERELARDGVEAAGYAALSSIGAFGPLRLTELASMLGTPLTTMSDLVRRLEKRGQVERRPHPDDRRSSLLVLSAAGDREWHAGWPALQRINKAISRGLRNADKVSAALGALADALDGALTRT